MMPFRNRSNGSDKRKALPSSALGVPRSNARSKPCATRTPRSPRSNACIAPSATTSSLHSATRQAESRTRRNCSLICTMPGRCSTAKACLKTASSSTRAGRLEAIYAVFHREKCYRKLERQYGRFTRSDLAEWIWQEDGHGVEEQELFISMMQSCGICFQYLRVSTDGSSKPNTSRPNFFRPKTKARSRRNGTRTARSRSASSIIRCSPRP